MNDDPLSLLQSRGVLFTPPHAETFQTVIRNLQQGKQIESVPYVYMSLSQEEKRLRRKDNKGRSAFSRQMTQSCGISWRLDNIWVVSSWESHPGPGETDFIAEFKELDIALTAVYNYYFGIYTVINDWNIALHHHPEFNEVAVTRTILQAKKITRSQFEIIKHHSQTQFQEALYKNPWLLGIPHLFLEFSHITSSKTACYLRRDGSEAYIVEEE
jgi:hypothetical protein